MPASRVTSPQEFFGYQLGSDRKLARWDKIVEYFDLLATQSPKIKVENMGESVEGNPFLLVTISSADNIKQLEHYRAINLKLSDPRGITEDQARQLALQGKAVICQSMSLHATEVGGTQMAPELTYDLLTREDEETRRILDEVIFLMFPCFNPDGEIMVTDWYNRTLGTEYEGCTLPWLYHKYVGHDNNRDAFAQNMPESRYVGQVMLRDWKPQAYQDHHHMGSYGPRLYIAPYCDPIHPYGDPLIWREHSWYGAHMAYKLEEAGKTGIGNAMQFAGWAHMGYHWLTIYHNIAGMLTESASAKLATPLFIHPTQLRGAHARTMPEYEAQTNFPHPWPGGWWRLRDIVEQQKISAWALLDIAARCKETVLWNAYLKATRQTARGAADEVKAYVIPAEQHDPLTARKLVKILLNQGLEVKVARTPVQVGNCTYGAGSYVVSLAQPKMGVIKTLLARTLFPDNMWTRKPDGEPMIYDTTTDNVNEFMGVKTVPAECEPQGDFVVITGLPAVGAAVQPGTSGGGAGGGAGAGFVLDGRLNDSYRVVNRLLGKGVDVLRVGGKVPAVAGACELPPGAFYVPRAAAEGAGVAALAGELGVGLVAVKDAPGAMTPVKQQRIGMYQRYYAGNIDEGWTRFLLEQYEFPYVTLMDADFKAGPLKDKIDVLIIPDDVKEMIVGPENFKDSPVVARALMWVGQMPPEYRSGIGFDGVKAVKEFVGQGGRLVALNLAAGFAIDACELRVKNVVDKLSTKQYSTHGATLHVKVDTGDPLAYGMPEEALVLNFDSPAFDIQETFNADRYRIVARYPERDLLRSGWLIGEELIKGKVAVLGVKSGEGEVVLLGCRPQFRAQTHGTFKLLFNCLY
ncbi:MAG: M14 family metallopeptidase [Bacillota bacterium]|nr:M14 family metallopeptidase [Bacillota bacterium]